MEGGCGPTLRPGLSTRAMITREIRRGLWPSEITHCSVFQIGLNERPAYLLHLSLRVLKMKWEVLLVCLQYAKCCHPIPLEIVSRSGIWVSLECRDLVDRVLQNSICNF